MAWTTPGTATAGAVLTSAFWNAQVRDNMIELAPFSAAWTSWVPTLTSTGTNPTLGTGSTQSGRYLKVGRLVIGYALIAFGTSGTNAGTGTYTVSLPAIKAETNGQRIGMGRMLDSSASQYRPIQLSAGVGIGNQVAIMERLDQATTVTNVDAGTPWAWAASDEIRYEFMYEAAS